MSSAPAHAFIKEEVSPTARLVSLDAFRGAVILLMVLVNNSGGPANYRQLEHSAWDGWTATDVVYPSFLWIMGVAITLSFGKRMSAGVTRSALFRQVLQRSAILFALGLLLYLAPNFHFATMRIPGVLQRIAVCYLTASAIYLTTRVRGQALWIGALLGVYAVLMLVVPVPGFGAGRLDLPGNMAHFVDRAVFGVHNYKAGDWDPEGLVSTLPAIATTLFGILAGHILKRPVKLAERAQWLVLAGVVLIVSGEIVNHWMPINKKLWSDSFALFMAGFDFVLFAAFAWVVDGLGYRKWTRPLVVVGMNALAIYLFSEALSILLDATDAHEWIYDHLYAGVPVPQVGSLLFAVTFVVVCWSFGLLLYKRGWFWKI